MATLAVIVSGTDDSIPTGPKTQPQKIVDITITSGDNPRPRPMTRGSTILLTETLIRV